MTRYEFEQLVMTVELEAQRDANTGRSFKDRHPQRARAVEIVLDAFDAQASALAEARRLGACEKCGKEGPDVLPFWCEACAAGTLGQMDDYWKRIAVAESRATEAEARLAALAAPSPEPGPGDAHIGLGPAASLATAARSQGEKEGYRRGFREGVEAALKAMAYAPVLESGSSTVLSIGAAISRLLAAGSADTRTEVGE